MWCVRHQQAQKQTNETYERESKTKLRTCLFSKVFLSRLLFFLLLFLVLFLGLFPLPFLVPLLFFSALLLSLCLLGSCVYFAVLQFFSSPLCFSLHSKQTYVLHRSMHSGKRELVDHITLHYITSPILLRNDHMSATPYSSISYNPYFSQTATTNNSEVYLPQIYVYLP